MRNVDSSEILSRIVKERPTLLETNDKLYTLGATV